MGDVITNVSTGWGEEPLIVVMPPKSMIPDDRPLPLYGAFWNKSAATTADIGLRASPDYATLGINLDCDYDISMWFKNQNLKLEGPSGPSVYCLLPHGVSTTAEVIGELAMLHFYIHKDLLRQLRPDVSEFSPMYGYDPSLLRSLYDLSDWVRHSRQKIIEDPNVYRRLMGLMQQLVKTLVPLRGPELLPRFAIRRTFDLMQSKLDEPVKIQDLANALNMSEAHFSRAFRNTTGRPPGSVFRHLRLAKARQLIETTDYGMIDIAETVGYSDPSFFAKAFRENYGVAPNRWRQGRRARPIPA
ncbi:MAG: helix-turn-helix domain-containing protein [Pseudomonadota bacterium]